MGVGVMKVSRNTTSTKTKWQRTWMKMERRLTSISIHASRKSMKQQEKQERQSNYNKDQKPAAVQMRYNFPSFAGGCVDAPEGGSGAPPLSTATPVNANGQVTHDNNGNPITNTSVV